MPFDRPDPSEYAPYYAGYVDLVPVGSIMDTLRNQRESTREFFSRIPEEASDYRYAPEKWSIRDVMGHMVDTERVFGSRVFHFARSSGFAFPSMDQDRFAKAAAPMYARRTLSSIAQEFYLLRGANLEQFSSWDDEILALPGVASGVNFTVRSVLYIMAGHERHHVQVLRERYL